MHVKVDAAVDDSDAVANESGDDVDGYLDSIAGLGKLLLSQ